jgi:[FeFe] hydrogenase H-cluster maturation GTPase HydF
MTKGKDAKPHIGIFGRRNSGKSSIINLLAGQDVAIVSEIAGTTTDPVKKSIEIDEIGPVVMIDTAGMDDIGELGAKRVEKTFQTLKTIDLAILLFTNNSFEEQEQKLIANFKDLELPFLIVHNKSDIMPLGPELQKTLTGQFKVPVIDFSVMKKNQSDSLLKLLKDLIPETAYKSKSLVGDLIRQGDIVLLITPIDKEAPEGRLILPQVQAIRDILDNEAVAVVAKEREIDHLLRTLHPRPSLAITDSQVFPKADASVPKDIPLTSFSILLAHQKGDFVNYLKGTPYISRLKDGDKILILESCTHHVSCDDIGRVKIPRLLNNFTGRKLVFEIVSGLDEIPEGINHYSMVIQCGGCMITRRQIINRLKPAINAGIPVSNYGMALAYVLGIYNRAIEPFVTSERQKEDYL